MPTIRPPEPEDADALGAVHVRAWQAAYRGLMADDYLDNLRAEDRAQMWVEGLSQPPRDRRARFVAEDDAGSVVGFVLAGPEGGEAEAQVGEIYALNVDPDAWGTGAGRALLEAGTAHLRDVGFDEAVLWVHPGNDRARRFYERAGWDLVGEERVVEVQGIDAPEIRYRRSLVA